MINNYKQVIAVDIDDVLTDTVRNFIDFSNNRWNTNLSLDDYDENWSHMWQVDHEEWDRRSREYHNSKVIIDLSHDPASLNVLKKLKNDFDLIVVTSRNNSLKNDTITWVNNNYPDIFRDIYFTGFFNTIDRNSAVHTKGNFCKQLNVDYIIDDQVKHCLSSIECGIKALLFGDYKWNQIDGSPDGLCRVNDWGGVLEYFYENK